MKRLNASGILIQNQESLFSKSSHDKRPVLITGGAGFIGTNVADCFLSAGRRVIIYDNLSRAGVEQNLEWLQQKHGNRLEIEIGDMRDAPNVRFVAKQASKVFHFAAQVAGIASLEQRIEDFEINTRGTLNLLEAIRSLQNPPPLIFTSTNKVYGDLADVTIRERISRYEPNNPELRENGFSEKRRLDFHSPYGCSKRAAEQYVLDYSRTFDLPAIVFRMSCIYGLHQFGTEDQGWVAHFLIRALKKIPITIYGDGKQVRDVLFIDDLVNAFLLAHEHMGELSGNAFNIGGGPENTISLLELLDLMTEVNSEIPQVKFDQWRIADQQYYVSDIRKFSAATGWWPRVSVAEGVKRLNDWLLGNRDFSPTDLDRIEDHTVSLNEAQQMAVIQSQSYLQTHEPRSKRLWEETHRNGVFTRTNGEAAR